jgi:hypothetical protein
MALCARLLFLSFSHWMPDKTFGGHKVSSTGPVSYHYFWKLLVSHWPWQIYNTPKQLMPPRAHLWPSEIPRVTFWKSFSHSLVLADLQYTKVADTTSTCAAVSLSFKCTEDRERNDDDETHPIATERTNNSSRVTKEKHFPKARSQAS